MAPTQRRCASYQSTSFLFEDAGRGAGKLFSLWCRDHIYARTSSPQAVLEQRISRSEGSAGGGRGSGMAAIDVALATLARAGDHVIVASTVYGGSRNLVMAHVLQGGGISSTRVARERVRALAAAITPHARRCSWVGGQPLGRCGRHCRHRCGGPWGVAVVVDNTCATPLLVRSPITRRGRGGCSATKLHHSGHGSIN